MTQDGMTDRQAREREYYEEYVRRNTPASVNFAPIEGEEKRPWNSYWRFLGLVKQHFKSADQRLLDVGCGPGDYAAIYAKIGYEVFGFDITPGNIAVATALSERYGLGHRTHFTVSPAETLSYPDEHFDVVTGINILHHIDIARSLAECQRVLKKGGIALFHEPVRAPIFDILRESKVGISIVSKEASFDRHVTQDERKLNSGDLELIRKFGTSCSFERFLLFSRFDRFLPSRGTGPSVLERFDFGLFKVIPFIRRFGGECIIILRK